MRALLTRRTQKAAVEVTRRMATAAQRIHSTDWNALVAQLDERGYALTQPLLTEQECDQLVQLYDARSAFRSRIVMARHNFGRGEYQYFADPLPSLVQELHEHFYPALAEIANRFKLSVGTK